MVKNSNFRKNFLPVDSVDSGDSESLAYKNFSEFWKIFSRSLVFQSYVAQSQPNRCTLMWVNRTSETTELLLTAKCDTPISSCQMYWLMIKHHFIWSPSLGLPDHTSKNTHFLGVNHFRKIYFFIYWSL